LQHTTPPGRSCPGCKDNIIAGRSMPASWRAFGVARQQKSAGVNSFAQIKKDLKPYMGQ
jgi:hypothetical protein